MNSNYSLNNAITSQVPPVSLEQATSLIVERAKQLVNRLVEDRGHDKPPFLPGEFAHLQGITRILKANLGEIDAVLLRFSSGDVIKVNENHHPSRQNFSCAHEIGHSLLSELKLEPCIEDVEFRTFNPQVGAIARAKAKERLCDAAAAELLMPAHIFKRYVEQYGVSTSAIEHLSSTFKTSFPAIVRRMVELSLTLCAAIQWRIWRRRHSKVLRLGWRFVPEAYKADKTSFIPINRNANKDSVIYKALETSEVTKCHKMFKVNKEMKRCYTESKGFGYGENRYVISLVFPK